MERQSLVKHMLMELRGTPDGGEQKMQLALLKHWSPQGFEHPVAAEWEYRPGFTNLGRGDLVFASSPAARWSVDHEPADVLIVEIKHMREDSGATARVKRTKGRKKVVEQVENSMRAWARRHPDDHIFGLPYMNDNSITRELLVWTNEIIATSTRSMTLPHREAMSVVCKASLPTILPVGRLPGKGARQKAASLAFYEDMALYAKDPAAFMESLIQRYSTQASSAITTNTPSSTTDKPAIPVKRIYSETVDSSNDWTGVFDFLSEDSDPQHASSATTTGAPSSTKPGNKHPIGYCY